MSWQADIVWSCPIDADSLGRGWLSGRKKGGPREKGATSKEIKVKGSYCEAGIQRGCKDPRKEKRQLEAVKARTRCKSIFFLSLRFVLFETFSFLLPCSFYCHYNSQSTSDFRVSYHYIPSLTPSLKNSSLHLEWTFYFIISLFKYRYIPI